MSTPEDQLPFQQTPQASPLDQYMSTYGDRLRSMLASDPYGGSAVDPGMAAAGQVSDLGPDLYQPRMLAPPQSAMAARGGQGGSAAPQGGKAPRSALEGAQDGQEAPAAESGEGQDGVTFRKMWDAQTKATREKYLDQLQDHLKQTNESIDSAYKTMMQQLGGRPDKSLSKDQKGMLLMEFGMRMMAHSAPQYGKTNTLGGALGEAGTETLQSAKGMIAGNVAQQQRYDQMRQQLTIAQGKEKAQLAARSALEEGRDVRAYGQQNAMLERTALQQQGAGERNTARIEGQSERTATTEAGKDRRARLAAGQVKRTVTGDDGSIYGVTGTGALVQLEKDGKSIKANPGGGPGGGKLTAAQANYNLYMSTYGTDKNGKPLEGDDLKAAQGEALKYAANPRTYQLSDPQMRQMAEKSADSFIRANPTSWMGMSPDEVQSKRAEYAEQEYTRLKRGGPANLSPPPGPRSALENAGKTPTQRTPGSTGAVIPSSPPPDRAGPNAKQLALLNSNPQKNAPFFLQKFGYLPKEYQHFAQPQSALGR